MKEDCEQNEAARATEYLVAGLRQGDEERIAEFFRQYYGKLLAHMKWKIPHRLRSAIDEAEVVQTAFRTFCRRARQGLYELASSENIMALLVCIARRKLMKQIARAQAQKRGGDVAIVELLGSLASSDPTPDELAAFEETVQSARDKLPSEAQKALELVMQGYTSEEIQEQLGINDYRVRFVRKTLLDAIEVALRRD